MNKYKGAILDSKGFVIFEFTTRYCAGYTEATQHAWAILEAWKKAHPDDKFYYVLNDGE